MTDEVAIEEEVETPEEELETPEPTKEQVAREWLAEQGIDEFDAKKVKNISAWERDTNAKASDLGRIAKELEAARTAATPAEAISTLDAETQTELKNALKTIGLDVDSLKSVVALSQQTVTEGREEAFETFTATHNDVDPSDLVGELVENGVDPQHLTPFELKRELNKAYNVVKAGKLDPEALKKAAIAEYIESLGKKGVKPEDVTEVKKGRGSAAGSHRNLNEVLSDPSVSIFDKFDAVAQKQ
jgi:hypothetical protein